jgi:hypothetical protein
MILQSEFVPGACQAPDMNIRAYYSISTDSLQGKKGEESANCEKCISGRRVLSFFPEFLQG